MTENEKHERLREAATKLLAAIDRTNFYDLGLARESTEKVEDGLSDDDVLDGSGACKDGPLTAGDVRRLREALR